MAGKSKNRTRKAASYVVTLADASLRYCEPRIIGESADLPRPVRRLRECGLETGPTRPKGQTRHGFAREGGVMSKTDLNRRSVPLKLPPLPFDTADQCFCQSFPVRWRKEQIEPAEFGADFNRVVPCRVKISLASDPGSHLLRGIALTPRCGLAFRVRAEDHSTGPSSSPGTIVT